MTAPRVLLERHKPRLVYDSHEAYFADSAAIWTDNTTNALKRADGKTVAAPPKLSLAYLAAKTSADGTAVQPADVIGESTKDYAKHAAALHKLAQYRDRLYG